MPGMSTPCATSEALRGGIPIQAIGGRSLDGFRPQSDNQPSIMPCCTA
jgi:hypothetical protein